MAAWIGFSLIAVVLFGLTGVTQKLSTNNISTEFSFLGFSLAFVGISLVLWLWFPLDLHLQGSVLALGLLGGALNGFGALTSFAAFEAGGAASLVMPIISLYPLVTVLCAKLFLGEQITPSQWLGVLLAPIAAWLLSSESSE